MAEAAKTGRVGRDLTTGPILHGLLLFAIPIVLTNIIQQFYSMVDLIVIGQFVGNAGSIGVNTGGEAADMVAPMAMGFATAGQIFIAQLVGAKNSDKLKKAIGTLLTFTMTLSVLLGAFIILFCKPILHALNCPEIGWNEAAAYMIITAIGTPFVFGYNAVVGILRGMGESKRPLLFIIVAALVNIVLDVILVAVFRLGAAGTAIATIASQLGSFLASFFFMYKRREQFGFELKLSYFKLDMGILKVLIRLGVPQVVRSLLVRFGMLWVNSSANAFGEIVSTTNGLGNKIQKFMEVFVQGIDTASASMIAQNLGAKKTDRAGKTTLYTAACALACAFVSCLVALFAPRLVFRVFTKDPLVIEMGVTFLRIFMLHFVMSALAGSFQAMVTGCGFVEMGFVLGVLDGLVMKIGLSLLFMNVFQMGFEGLWWGVAASRIQTVVICVIYFLSGKWKTYKLLTDK